MKNKNIMFFEVQGVYIGWLGTLFNNFREANHESSIVQLVHAFQCSMK